MRLLRGLFGLIFNLLAVVLFLAILPVIAGLAILVFFVIGVVWACSDGPDAPRRGPERHD
jgi:hypothetical protein